MDFGWCLRVMPRNSAVYLGCDGALMHIYRVWYTKVDWSGVRTRLAGVRYASSVEVVMQSMQGYEDIHIEAKVREVQGMIQQCAVCLQSHSALWTVRDSDGDTVTVCEKCEEEYYKQTKMIESRRVV